ncbi:hypothetical protein ONZ45_g13990 [Pleurotus djamor]|nr:hypothetical protein ONZ45_g13990 [Pleurotus djamor]
MTIFSGPPLPYVPDDLSIPQFILDSHHPSRPVRKFGVPWLIDDVSGARVGFDELRARSNAFANALKIKYNIGESDVVCLFSSNHIDYPTVVWGVHRLGGIVSTANPSYTADELHYQLQISGSRLIVTHPNALEVAAVAISHYAVIANVIQMAVHHKIDDPSIPPEVARFAAGNVCTAVLPFFHIYGLIVNLHFAIFSAVTIVVIPKFNFTDFLETVVRYRITDLMIVPPMLVLLCKHPAVKKYDLTHIKGAWSGAAPLSVELVRQVSQVLPNAIIGQGFGMTETATAVSLMPVPQRLGNGSVGTMMPGCAAKVLKQDGTLGGVGELGELVVTGPNMALRYHGNEQATKETFVDGWVHTGDEVYFDENHELYIVDRLKELIKVRGFQVPPAELEGHLLGHPYVGDVAVVSIPDDYSGELPLAYVVPATDIAERIKNPAEAEKVRAELIKHVSDHKVKYKWLEGGLEFIDAIPKNPSGKLLRRVLRDKARADRKLRAKL